ncbi:4-hydroxy-tetrahydrodipicolinate reductase, partial [Streptomyces sp. NPDC059129]
MSKLRVAVLGARGRIGSEAVRAVEAADDLELVAAPRRGVRKVNTGQLGSEAPWCETPTTTVM